MKKTLLIGLTSIISSQLFAGSRVIKDNRLDDLSIPPSLARGYSIATNTYQSICMDNLVATTPSYNMKYFYQEIERDWENSYRNRVDQKTSFRYLFLKQNVDFTVETSGNNTYHQHNIFAHIKLDSYYNSLNEAESTLSEHAIDLLQRGDTVGFFDSCGPYYVRSIGRHSNFFALLTYRTTSSERDTSFEIKLKTTLNGFFSSGSSNTEIDGEFRTETQSKQLRITIWANGLGKDHLADIIPTDIESFRESIRQAIGTMQDADSGIVTSMEVSPWIENLQFQRHLKLESEDESDSENRRLRYQEKKNLEANSELIAEIDRVDRAQMDQYYKAKNCRRILEEEYPSDGPFPYDPDRTWFSDLSARGQTSRQARLSYLLEVLSESAVEGYLEANEQFLYGANPESEEAQGAVGCLDSLYDAGLDQVHFRTIPACVAARATSVPIAPLLDHYCLPELARVEEVEEELN